MKNLDSEMEILHWEKPLKTIKSTQCLKIPEKVLFNIASEASNVYILGQKLVKIKKQQMRHFG